MGAFAKSSNGNYYLVHRGNMQGISKEKLKEIYKGEWVTVIDGGKKSEVMLIGQLDNSLPERIRDFVYEVEKIKPSFGYMIEKVLDVSAKEESFAGHPTI